MNRIQELIGELSAAFWDRATKPGASPLAAMLAPEYKPESDEEIRIWEQLTSPDNLDELIGFVQSAKDAPVNDSARRLYRSILAAATRRQEAWLLERAKSETNS
jgi:hypothetical protein